MKAILFDSSLCNGCYGCQMACKDEHCGNSWLPIAAEQPQTGQFWCRVDQETRGKTPEVKVQYTPVLCAHCDDAPCIAAGEDGAVYRREDGLVIIDPEKSKGQRQIVDACPAKVIYWNDELEIPQKCTGCAHLLDDGWTVPRCVDVCATGALTYVDEEDIPAGAEPMPAVAGNHPHVYYLNIPGKWVYGVLVDRNQNEVLIGAEVSLLDEAGNILSTVKTDDFGEFRFKDLKPRYHKVLATLDGYADVELDADTTEQDVVLGDIFVKEVPFMG